MKKVNLEVLCLFILSSFVFAQVHQQWAVRYNGSNNTYDIASTCIVDCDGNIYITGSSSDNISASRFTTIKYNSYGVQLWVATYSGPVNGLNHDNIMAIDSSGNIIVTGSSEGNGSGEDIALIKYNSAGIQQWATRYTESGNSIDQPMAIITDPQNNIYIAGRCEYENGDFIIIKYNANGILQWIDRYNGPSNNLDVAYSISRDILGNTYVAGKSWLNLNSWEYAVIKYNNNGIRQWVSRHAGSVNGSTVGCKIVTNTSGDVFFASSIYLSNSGFDYLTLKYNTNGIYQWEAIYNGSANEQDEATAIALDAGNIFVTGYSTSINTSIDCITIKYNTSGVMQWIRNFDRGYNDIDKPSRVVTDNSGNIYITGSSVGNGTGYDYITLKYNQQGIQQWLKTYNGSGNNTDISRSIAVDLSGNVYITGWTSETIANSDFTTIKYSQFVGIIPISPEIPEKFSLYQNYPNPFNPTTNIRFDIPPSRPGERLGVRVVIYDLLGREVATLVNEQLKPGTYEVEWNGSNYASGVYFYSLLTSEFTQTKKLILLK